MHLAFGGAGPDGTPGDEIGEILRRRHVEELDCRRHAEIIDLDREAVGRGAGPLLMSNEPVEFGVVDQPLPPHGRARLFEINAHDDLEFVSLNLFAFGPDEAPGV